MDNSMIFFIVLLVIIVFCFIFSFLYDRFHHYTQNELRLMYADIDNGAYYFFIKVHVWQFNKIHLLYNLYKQGSIIQNEIDKTFHIVDRFGTIKNGILKIYTHPYILNKSDNIININIYNYGEFNLSFINSQNIENLQSEIIKNYKNEPGAKDALKTLDAVKNRNAVNKDQLKDLNEFISKHECLLSIASSLVQMITSILGLMI